MESNSMARCTISGFSLLLFGGLFLMGCIDTETGFVAVEGNDSIPAFYLKETEVSNSDYLKFVQATGYRTCAEIGLDGLGPGAFRFEPDSARICFVGGLTWRHPERIGAQPADWKELPVVHLCKDDMLAYAGWLGQRLPSRAELNWAMQKNRSQPQQNRPHGNTWQGLFPLSDLGEDGFQGRLAPARSFEPIHGIFDLVGNAWEATSDSCSNGYWAVGGSYLCAPNWCRGYRLESPICVSEGIPFGHVGFRTAKTK